MQVETVSGSGRSEVPSEVLAGELGVPVEAVEGASVAEVQALVDDAPESFWEWVNRYQEVETVGACVREEVEDPPCVLVMRDEGVVVLSTTGRRSHVLRMASQCLDGLGAQPDAEEIERDLAAWGEDVDREVVFEEVVEPDAVLRVSPPTGWRVRVWAPSIVLEVSLAKVAAMVGIEESALAAIPSEWVERVLAARLGTEEVRQMVSETLLPHARIAVVEALHERPTLV